MNSAASKATAALIAAWLAGCAQLPQAEDIVSACQGYVGVKAVVDLVAILYPSIVDQVGLITQYVDPVCKAVLAGQGAPPGTDAAWVRQKTLDLEALERTAHR